MGTLLVDVRWSLRTLWKDRRFTLAALLALALGIGATSAIYTVTDAVLLRPLPFPEPDALVEIQSAMRNGFGVCSFPDYQDFRARNHSLSALAAYGEVTVTLTGHGDPQQLDGLALTPSLFDVLRVNPMLGRRFTDGDAVVGSKVVIIAHALWQGRYRGDPDVIGRTISLDGKLATIVGVMPPGFHFPLGAGGGAPLVYLPFPNEEADLGAVNNRGNHAFVLVGRMAPGTRTVAAAQADLDAVAASMRIDHPSEREDHNLTVRVTAMRERVVGPVRPALVLLLCAVLCVLVIACADGAGLLLARATVRRREVAIRSTLGASRARIVRQLLTESALLAVVGGAVGLLLALWLVDLLLGLVTPSLPQLHDVAVDGRVLLVTAGVSLLSSLAFGLVPALQASRVDLQESLKEASRSASHHSRRSRNALLVVEIAVALVLLFGAGLALRSFAALRAVDPGFRPDGLVVAQVDLPSSRYAKDEDGLGYYRRLTAALASLPGAEAVGIGAPLPFSHAGIRTGVHVTGQPVSSALSAARIQAVAPGYFAAMGMPLLHGRNFSAVDDDEKSAPTVIVSSEFARKLSPGEEPLGKHVDIGMTSYDDKGHSTTCEIIGVVGDIRRDSLAQNIIPAMYVTLGRFPIGIVGVAVRSSAPAAMVPAVRQAILSVDHDLPPTTASTMESLMDETVRSERMLMVLLGLFAATALVLATIGIYGVMSYTVTQRRRELGIRIAVGAQLGQILSLVLGESLRLAALGVAIGIAVALAVGRLGRSLLFGVRETDPLTLGAVAALLVVVSLAASFVPAWRATRVDPMEALRDD
jgi:predicted permease